MLMFFRALHCNMNIRWSRQHMIGSFWVKWCTEWPFLCEDTQSLKLMVPFSPQRQKAEAVTTIIQGEPVESMKEYEYLGTVFGHLLRFSFSTEEMLKKCNQRQHLLKKLKSFGTNKDILPRSSAYIENVISFSFTCWFHSITLRNRNRLLNVINSYHHMWSADCENSS